MSTFTFNALDTLGHSITGELIADGERAALRELSRRGLTPLALSTAAQSKRGVHWRKRGSLEDHSRLINELAVLLGAGVSLNEAIDITSRSRVHYSFIEGLEGISRALRQGETIFHAIQNNIKTFPPYVYQLIKAGEETGSLTNALKDACVQMQFDDRTRKDIRQALVYPLFLLIMGCVATLFIFIAVIPRFAAMLRERIEFLPFFSRTLFHVGAFMHANILPASAAAAVLVAVIAILFRDTSVRAWLREFSARLPILGKFVVETEAGRWTAMLAILLQNRVPLVHSLSIAKDSLRLESLKARLDQVERGVRNGSALAAALADYRLFDEALINLVSVGERSGRLAEMLQSAALLAEQKGKDRIKRMMALLEPLSILVIGGIIGTIVIALFTAIASINNVPL